MEPWEELENPWESEQNIEQELENEMEILKEVESESIPPTNVFEKGTRSSIAFDPETPKKRKSIVPSSPPCGSSPLYSNLQPTPIPSDFDIFNKKVKINIESQLSASSFGSLENKTGLYFESDDDSEIQKSFNDIQSNFTPNGFGFESDDDEPGEFKSKLEANFKFDKDKSPVFKDADYDMEEDPFPSVEQSNSRDFQHSAHRIFQESLQKTRNENSIPPTCLLTNYSIQPSGLHVKAVTSNGDAVYFPTKTKKTTVHQPVSRNILSENIAILIDKAREQIKYDDTTRKMKEMTRGRLNLEGEKKTETKLWIDKYSPKMYIDLVGDEYLNRSILAWVKHWDYCVFGKELKKSLLNVGKGKTHMKFDKPTDKLQRPDKKVLLLAGPPGLGKTTLAHVVAKHAGYNIIEINASDDRGSEVIKNRITSALESKSVFGNKKPNLIIIDEIDGASATGSGDQTFINLLVKIVQGSSDSKGKGKKRERDLRRPIICICNDPFAPVLRPLRMIAQVYTFKPPLYLSLAKRLLEICNWEGLKASLQTMLTLCEMTQGDMRSSINTLQFIKQNTSAVTKKDLISASVGNKDISESWYKVAESIFFQGDPNRKAATDLDKYTFRLKALIDANGDPDKLLHVCFENYFKIKHFEVTGKNTNLESRYVQQASFLHFYDSLQKRIWKDQRYELHEYLAYPIINFYRLFATPVQLNLDFPNNSYHCEVNRKQTAGIEQSLYAGMTPHIKCFWSNHTLNIIELAPYLMNIISPNFKPANIQVLKPPEKLMLERIIKVCIDFGIRLAKQNLENGTVGYSTDPAINMLIDFEPFNKSRRSIASFPYAISNFISNQIEYETIRRSNGVKKPKGIEIEKAFVSSSQSVIESQKPLSELISSNIGKTKLKSEKLSKDFFGRIIKPEEISTSKSNSNICK
ncbi:hypothetical protein HDV06_006090 [Boothiomyces sp. JEL0866]|nr:hypothetical protein HDV06_006040 [Boothiomyces sp. JEL0866]KAJ3324832.1 hypothetical protein HDV06_006090 [Boothiomyces sp. JEL0866]